MVGTMRPSKSPTSLFDDLTRRLNFNKIFKRLTIFAVVLLICSLAFLKRGNMDVSTIVVPRFNIPSTRAHLFQQPDDMIINRSDHQFTGLEVRSAANFTTRIREFNAALETIRHRILLQRVGRQNGNWTNEMDQNNLRVIHGGNEHFMKEVNMCPRITTIVLPWQHDPAGISPKPWSSLTDIFNLLHQSYPEWTADNTLCTWIETPGLLRLKADVVFNFTCNRNINDTLKRNSLFPTLLYSKPLIPGQYWPNNGKMYPAHFYTDPPPFVTYMFIHTDAIVTSLGAVFSKNCKLVLYGCRDDVILRSGNVLPENVDTLPVYDEIFVISQYWGWAIFHRMVEIMPRIALHLEFLRSNTQIRIAATEGDGGRLGELLRVVGINSSRLVAGNIRGKAVYQPRSTGCGFANAQEPQVLNKVFIEYSAQNFPSRPRNGLVLIRRSRSRRFTQQKAIEETAERLAREHKLNFTVYRDDPAPSLNETMQMFYFAAIVVAPHGAGLTNALFSQPGTFVIEGVCNRPHENLCIQRLIHILGHHWHGLASRRGCESVVDVAATEVESALHSYIRLWEMEKHSGWI